MSHMVENMAYAGTVPWHGLGVPVSNDLTPAQMLKAAKLDWTVSKRDMFLQDGTVIPDRKALVRDTDNTVLSVVGNGWKHVQNEEAMEFFSKFVVAGHMKMETAGSLRDGKQVWGLARINRDFNVAGNKNDRVQNYLLMHSPHLLGKALEMKVTPIRVVCWNTLTMALGASIRGKATPVGTFKNNHSLAFNDNVKAKAEKVLGLAIEQIDEFKEASAFLASKKASAKEITEFFGEVLMLDNKSAREHMEDLESLRVLPMFEDALLKAPGQKLATAKGTWWGAVNAVTYVVDHEIGRSRDTAMNTAWFGNKAQTKRNALNIALKKAA